MNNWARMLHRQHSEQMDLLNERVRKLEETDVYYAEVLVTHRRFSVNNWNCIKETYSTCGYILVQTDYGLIGKADDCNDLEVWTDLKAFEREFVSNKKEAKKYLRITKL